MSAPEQPRGIVCPKCGCADPRTTHILRLPRNRVRRYKRCRYCNCRIVTTESTPATDANASHLP